nr:hypothetical protein [Oenococcus oeni]
MVKKNAEKGSELKLLAKELQIKPEEMAAFVSLASKSIYLPLTTPL